MNRVGRCQVWGLVLCTAAGASWSLLMAPTQALWVTCLAGFGVTMHHLQLRGSRAPSMGRLGWEVHSNECCHEPVDNELPFST